MKIIINFRIFVQIYTKLIIKNLDFFIKSTMSKFVAYSLNDYRKKNPIVYLVVIVNDMDMLSKLLSMLPEQLTDKLEGSLYKLKKTDFEIYFRKEEEKEQKQNRHFLINNKSLVMNTNNITEFLEIFYNKILVEANLTYVDTKS